MIKNLSKTKTFILGCAIPTAFIALFHTVKTLGFAWASSLDAIVIGFLVLSFPWSAPSFALVGELNGLIGSEYRSYLQAACLILGFGINFLIAFKFGLRYWLVSVCLFALFIIILALLFTLWTLFRGYL